MFYLCPIPTSAIQFATSTNLFSYFPNFGKWSSTWNINSLSFYRYCPICWEFHVFVLRCHRRYLMGSTLTSYSRIKLPIDTSLQHWKVHWNRFSNRRKTKCRGHLASQIFSYRWLNMQDVKWEILIHLRHWLHNIEKHDMHAYKIHIGKETYLE